jgi:hypothetical protein
MAGKSSDVVAVVPVAPRSHASLYGLWSAAPQRDLQCRIGKAGVDLRGRGWGMHSTCSLNARKFPKTERAVAIEGDQIR